MTRIKISLLSASATALVGLLIHEGYKEEAYIPVKGDVPTIGYGTTKGVKMGDKTDPIKALKRAYEDMKHFEGAIKRCVTVPLYQHEYDAYLSLSYNIGENAFCRSTLVRLLNQGEYDQACKQILRWDKFQGKPLRGLTIRREQEYKKCLGL